MRIVYHAFDWNVYLQWSCLFQSCLQCSYLQWSCFRFLSCLQRSWAIQTSIRITYIFARTRSTTHFLAQLVFSSSSFTHCALYKELHFLDLGRLFFVGKLQVLVFSIDLIQTCFSLHVIMLKGLVFSKQYSAFYTSSSCWHLSVNCRSRWWRVAVATSLASISSCACSL